MAEGTGGTVGGGSGGAILSGTGGQVAAGGGSGHDGEIGLAGGATSPPGSGGLFGMAGRPGAGGADPGASGGIMGQGGSPGTAGMAAAGGRGSPGASGGMPVVGTGGAAGAGRGGAVGSGGIIGTGGGTSATGGVVGNGGSAGHAGAGGAPADSANLNFETSSQNWFVAEGTFANVGRSTARAFAGVASLGATLQYTASSTGVTNTLAVSNLGSNSPPGPGSVITFHIYLPANAPAIDWIQPFLQDSSFAYFGAYTVRQSLKFGAWNTIKLTLPATAASGLHLLGVELYTTGSTSLSDDVFIDAIDW